MFLELVHKCANQKYRQLHVFKLQLIAQATKNEALRPLIQAPETVFLPQMLIDCCNPGFVWARLWRRLTPPHVAAPTRAPCLVFNDSPWARIFTHKWLVNWNPTWLRTQACRTSAGVCSLYLMSKITTRRELLIILHKLFSEKPLLECTVYNLTQTIIQNRSQVGFFQEWAKLHII